ncbi:hypothetical protein Acr_00g0034580 [Actinidia rufa]|uniref:Uncharacterized protein n=1 Tax=Actinidia rufa TaxID=165716 RepID=A0A7J0DGI5_9ERIC|nr:hypothetical protein Acr_00g0034580 [Actinidia rufa]
MATHRQQSARHHTTWHPQSAARLRRNIENPLKNPKHRLLCRRHLNLLVADYNALSLSLRGLQCDSLVHGVGSHDDDDPLVGAAVWELLHADLCGGVVLELLDDRAGLSDDATDSRRVAKEAEKRAWPAGTARRGGLERLEDTPLDAAAEGVVSASSIAGTPGKENFAGGERKEPSIVPTLSLWTVSVNRRQSGLWSA